MKKMIIVAGSPNSGKTASTNLVICKLESLGHKNIKKIDGKEDFWHTLNGNGRPSGGTVIIDINDEKVGIITYGDIESEIVKILSNAEIQSCDTLICCSHATRGRKIFDFFHKYIAAVDLEEVQIIPIHKNLLSGFGNENKENTYTADLLMKMIEL